MGVGWSHKSRKLIWELTKLGTNSVVTMLSRVAFHSGNLWKGCTVYNLLNYTWYISYLHILTIHMGSYEKIVPMTFINHMPGIKNATN